MTMHNDRRTQSIFRRWHKAGEKAAVVVEVMSSITAAQVSMLFKLSFFASSFLGK
jgi:hypothetical protein